MRMAMNHKVLQEVREEGTTLDVGSYQRVSYIIRYSYKRDDNYVYKLDWSDLLQEFESKIAPNMLAKFP